MMDEQLIDEVAQHAVIYNRQKYYLNGSVNGQGAMAAASNKYETKDEAWQNIALKLRSDGKCTTHTMAKQKIVFSFIQTTTVLITRLSMIWGKLCNHSSRASGPSIQQFHKCQHLLFL